MIMARPAAISTKSGSQRRLDGDGTFSIWQEPQICSSACSIPSASISGGGGRERRAGDDDGVGAGDAQPAPYDIMKRTPSRAGHNDPSGDCEPGPGGGESCLAGIAPAALARQARRGRGWSTMAPLTSVRQDALFVAGQGGYHTYRIPAVVATTKRTLLAFCEGRTGSSSDSDDIDIVLRRSHDNGHTWTDMQVVADGGGDTIGNPCPVVDRSTGTIWLPLCWNARLGPEPQIIAGKAQRTVWLGKSTDDGASWSTPVEITQQVKKPGWRWYATGPGHGVQLANGRLVVPCDFSAGDPDAQHRHFGSHVIYSDDHGATWQIGGVIAGQVNECALALLGDGRLYLNMRSYHGANRRAVAWSSDNGATWSPVRTDQTLVEPVCQASLQSLGDQRLLFANPAGVKRENMTVRLSEDGGETWAHARSLHSGPSAYSDLVVCGNGSIGCLYECGDGQPYERITFACFGEQNLKGA